MWACRKGYIVSTKVWSVDNKDNKECEQLHSLVKVIELLCDVTTWF